jgi:hypothetical protein
MAGTEYGAAYFFQFNPQLKEREPVTIFTESEIERDEREQEHLLLQQLFERADRVCEAVLAELHAEDLRRRDGLSFGRRVFRAIPGRFKRFGNRFSYTGGGIKSGAKRGRSDGRRARRLAVEELEAQEAEREIESIDRQNLPAFHGQRLAHAALVAVGDGRSEQRLRCGKCQLVLVYEGELLSSAHAGPQQARHPGRGRHRRS